MRNTIPDEHRDRLIQAGYIREVAHHPHRILALTGRGLARLNSGLNTLLGIVDSADAAPTTQAVAMFQDLGKVLDEQLNRWNEIRAHDIPSLNESLKKAGRPPIEVK